MLDSGAAMSLFPAKFIDQKDYTGNWMTVRGAVGEQSLQPARVTVEVGGKKEDMCVLVTTEDTTPLLGMDYSHFEDIMWGELAKKRAKQEYNSPQPQQAVKTLKEDTSTDKEEEEDPHRPQEEKVLEDRVLAVQTRKQRERERQQQLQDDDASAASGAVPLDLATLDDSLFVATKERKKLTKSQKQAQTHAKSANTEKPRDLRLTEFTPKMLEEAQRDYENLTPLWLAAEEHRDGFHIGKGLLRHHTEDDWEDERDQLVVPTKYRHEIIELAHGAKLAAHLGSKRTTKKILRDFYWPGEVAAFCKACADCQRGSRTAAPKAPLQPLPVMEEPFRRVAVDIVGPLTRTKQGNKYVLTFMDFTSRYSEAIPLRITDAATMAEVLAKFSQDWGYHKRFFRTRARTSCQSS